MEDFQNPQQDPGTQKRLLLAFVLTFVVLMLMQPIMKKYGPQPPAKPEQKQQQGTGETSGATGGAPVATPPVAPPRSQVATPAVEVTQAAAEAETVVENELYRITFTNKGAVVKSWVLKKYLEQPGGKPLDLVNTMAAQQFGYPLSLWTADEGVRKKLNEALYVSNGAPALSVPATVSFEYADQELRVRKTFRFDHSYVVKVETSVTRNGAPAQAYPAWPAGFGDQTVLPSYAAAKMEYLNGGTITRLDIDKKGEKISGNRTLPGPFHWAGVSGQYFAAVFLPEEPESAVLVQLRHAVQIPKDPKKPEGEKVPAEAIGAAVGNPGGTTVTRLFAGPKNLDVLNEVHASLTKAERGGTNPGGEGEYHGPDLSGLVDFGKWFGFIAKPLFLWLKWTHDHWVANWGWAIIILTVIISVALFPLRLSSMKSTMKMAKLQPQIKAINEKYKQYKFNDPRKQEMQKEISALYKQHNVNPVGGCLPMLLQFPFLVAFYSMLGVAIELRHAPWLWVRDLSSPDPIYLLPILITGSMYWVQKITPQAGMDPVQQRMMMVMMPAMIGFISLNLAAGLGVYWVMSNVIMIVQQVWMNNTKFGQEMRETLEKAARKRKQ